MVHDQLCERAALFENGRLVEFWPKTQQAIFIGAICLVRVGQVFVKQNRVQCQLADGTPASFRISSNTKYRTGDLCWITLEAMGRQHKPWQASHGISRAGQLVVLHYGSDEVRASHKAGSGLGDELGQAVRSALPDGWGAVIKRAGLSAETDRLLAEITALLAPLGDGLADRLAACQAAMVPSLIYHGDDVRARVALASVMRHNRCERDDSYWADVAQEAHALCESQVVTANGAILHFEQTQALLAVDVDSGQSGLSPYALAKSVAEEILQILRLGCYSGVVVIDMPRLRPDDMAEIVKIMRQKALADQRHPDVLGVSRAGLIELRIRHRETLLASRLQTIS